MKEQSAGLNCCRWDYIFSYLKKLRTQNDEFVEFLTLPGYQALV